MKVVSSWGKEWGDGCFGYLSYDCVSRALARDKLNESPTALEEAEAIPGPEPARDPERELEFAEVERLFGGFQRVWNLTDAQATYIERVFWEKGAVLVQSPNRR